MVARLTHVPLTVACVAAVGLLAVLGLSKPLGYRALVDYSDSMRPAIAAGDVVVSRVVLAPQVRRGDVVSFPSPQRRELLTHRVVGIRAYPGRYAFVTRGDANTGVERWSIDADGRLGRMALRVPKVGYALAWIGRPIGRLVFVLGAGLALAVLLTRRLWTL